MVSCQAAFSERVESVENQTRRTIAGVRSFSDGGAAGIRGGGTVASQKDLSLSLTFG